MSTDGSNRKRLQKCFEHASKQIAQNNFDYANELLTQCVTGDPANVVYARAFIDNLRKKYGNNKKGARLAQFQEMGARRAVPKMVSAKQWEEVFKNGLKVLAINPWDIGTLRAMATAAQNTIEMADAEVELFWLKCAQEANPKDVDTNRQAAEALTERGQYDQAMACWNRIIQAAPEDEEAKRAIFDLHAKKTLANLGGAGERMAAAKRTTTAGPQEEQLSHEDQLRRQIAKSSQELPPYLELAQLYMAEDKFAEAEEVLTKALEASGGDPNVREKLEDLQVRRLRHQAAIARNRRKENPAAEEEYRRLRKELLEKEIEVYSHMAERYPTQLQYKYNLAERYQMAKKHDEAIKLFQQSRTDSRYRGLSLLGIGKSFLAINQKRLAMRNFEDALADIPERDADHRKEAMYLAGKTALEDISDLAAADKYLTGLAGVDYSYRDLSVLLDKLAQLRDNQGPK